MKLLGISLTDFQSHKQTEVKFSPTITTIKGPTDIGKSSILRALRWVCLNDLPGTSFVREGAKRTKVVVSVGEKGNSVDISRTKSRDAATNVYEIDGQELKAFGQNVPADVSRLCQLSAFNFQGQHDNPFWFSETAGEVSRQLNAVVDLTVIDTALSNIAAAVRKANERKEAARERLESAEFKLAQLAPQKKRITQFAVIQSLEAGHKKAEEKWERMRETLDRVLERRQQTAALLQQVTAQVEVVELGRKAVIARKRYDGLVFLLKGIKATQTKLASAPPDFGPVARTFLAATQVQAEADELEELILRIGERKQTAETRKSAASVAETKFHLRLKGMTCPLCKQIIET